MTEQNREVTIELIGELLMMPYDELVNLKERLLLEIDKAAIGEPGKSFGMKLVDIVLDKKKEEGRCQS